MISVFVTQERTNLSFTCDNVGTYSIAYNFNDTMSGVAANDAVVTVKCVPSTFFGLLSSNTTHVCSGRGYCVGSDTHVGMGLSDLTVTSFLDGSSQRTTICVP